MIEPTTESIAWSTGESMACRPPTGPAALASGMPSGDTRSDGLAGSLTRLDGVQSWLHLRHRLPDDPGERTWWRCSTVLTQPAYFDKWGAEVAGWLQARYGEAPERAVAGYLLSWYLSVPGLVAGLLFHRERRVPLLRPEDLAFRLGEPRPHPDGVALLDERFACLPDDQAAGAAEATVIADEAALAALARPFRRPRRTVRGRLPTRCPIRQTDTVGCRHRRLGRGPVAGREVLRRRSRGRCRGRARATRAVNPVHLGIHAGRRRHGGLDPTAGELLFPLRAAQRPGRV